MGTMEEDGAQDWKEKYETCWARQQEIETLSKDVLKEYDTLMKNFAELKQQNEVLQQKNAKREEELKDMEKLISPALKEYSTLKNKYEIEKGCRYEAQNYATHMVQQNNKLKRQSMDLFNVLQKTHVDIGTLDLDLDNDDDDDDNKSGENGYTNSLNEIIKELKNEVARLKTEREEYHQNLHLEKENYKWAQARYQALKTQQKQTEDSLKQHKDALKELSQVSEAAYEQYEEMKDRFELETKRRSCAEKKISEYAIQNNMMKRQSAALMQKLTPGDQLHRAIMEVEDLTAKLEEQRNYYDAQISELSSKVSECDGSAVENLESEKQSLEQERDELQQRLNEYTSKYSKLEAQYEEVQAKLEKALAPPPPPPPPPLPAIQTSKGFLSRITGGSKKKKVDKEAIIAKSGANANEEYSKALNEMLENIKRGKSLRPALKPVKKGEDESGKTQFKFMLKSRSMDDDRTSTSGSGSSESQQNGGAFAELQHIMSRMKRNTSESDLMSPIEKDLGDSELAQTFRKIRKTSVDEPPPVQRREKLSFVQEERESEVIPAKPGN